MIVQYKDHLSVIGPDVLNKSEVELHMICHVGDESTA